MNPHIPENYFPDDDVTREPVVKAKPREPHLFKLA